jgi:hypothetical protein
MSVRGARAGFAAAMTPLLTVAVREVVPFFHSKGEIRCVVCCWPARVRWHVYR